MNSFITFLWTTVLPLLLAVFATSIFVMQYEKWYKKKEKEKRLKKQYVYDIYTDYINEEKGLMIRVFPDKYETEALEGIPTNNVLEYGNMGLWKYYLIQI